MPDGDFFVSPPRVMSRTGTALKAIKQSVARRRARPGEHCWQARYYDFNVGTAEKRMGKLRNL